MAPVSTSWPSLPVVDWEPTYETLHLYAQVAGKVRLALTPVLAHWWEVGLQLTPRGITTEQIPYGDRTFALEFDLFDDQVKLTTSDGARDWLPMHVPVRDFHANMMAALHEQGIDVEIWPVPVEMVDPIPFDQDEAHHIFDTAQARRWWEVLRKVEVVFTEFRARFTGKCSPVQLYWGAFDLSVARYSGRPAEPPPNADRVTRLSLNAEQSVLGFWPGGTWVNGARTEWPVFYSYVYPEPDGYRDQEIAPAGAYYDASFGEYVLPYDEVRNAPDPRQAILDFAQSTYDAGARLQQWPREQLEWDPPPPPRPHAGMS
jgi:hypothetical protein